MLQQPQLQRKQLQMTAEITSKTQECNLSSYEEIPACKSCSYEDS